ncbi:hypothetical protein GCM10010493_57040 [Streptomyces lavendulae subsp. grasserius]
MHAATWTPLFVLANQVSLTVVTNYANAADQELPQAGAGCFRLHLRADNLDVAAVDRDRLPEKPLRPVAAADAKWPKSSRAASVTTTLSYAERQEPPVSRARGGHMFPSAAYDVGMPSSGIAPESRQGVSGSTGLAPARADRIIRALSWWWASAPVLLFTPAIAYAMGLPDVRREVGWMFGLMALLTAALAPTAGLVAAQVWDRREARGRFLIMAAVSSVPIAFFLFFGALFPECPDGYHC